MPTDVFRTTFEHTIKTGGWRTILAMIGFFCAVLLVCVLILAPQLVMAQPQAASAATTQKPLAIPVIDTVKGRDLFVSRGCVLCHSVNGVGGLAAPPLDAQDSAEIDLMTFVARMWRGAPAMIELQNLELGYFVDLTAQEIADLGGFVMDKQAQEDFSEAYVPEPMRLWMLDEPYWEGDRWPEDFIEGFRAL